MILLCDEDIGVGVPTALQLVGYETISMAKQGWLGIPDERWLEQAGRNGWLALSCNKKMLSVPAERETLIREKVGIIFLTSGQEYSARVLRLLLVKWSWLENIDRTAPRPFAWFLSPAGRTSQSYRGLKLQSSGL